MDDRRFFPRKYLMFYSRVYDQHTGELLGYVVDLSAGGMMIISETQIPSGKNYSLKMEVPDDLGVRQYILFDAQSVRCSPDIVDGFYDAGFQLDNVHPADLEIIARIIDSFGFRER